MEEPKTTGSDNMKIVGINVAIYAAYCILAALIEKNILSAFPLLVIHFIVCIILAIVYRRVVWLLSGILLLVLGFSTCVAAISIS